MWFLLPGLLLNAPQKLIIIDLENNVTHIGQEKSK